MVNFINPGILGDLPTFRRVFQAPIEKGAPCSVMLLAQQFVSKLVLSCGTCRPR